MSIILGKYQSLTALSRITLRYIRKCLTVSELIDFWGQTVLNTNSFKGYDRAKRSETLSDLINSVVCILRNPATTKRLLLWRSVVPSIGWYSWPNIWSSQIMRCGTGIIIFSIRQMGMLQRIQRGSNVISGSVVLWSATKAQILLFIQTVYTWLIKYQFFSFPLQLLQPCKNLEPGDWCLQTSNLYGIAWH